ncbi:PREDICTED: endophilin-A isoform X1 [Polistes canadensis]|uniref:endophilin-A isoform X1 n=1 Tax=Polistes canadensis TaxID=91411 RepID=UPI000718CCE3|nr:PREDICTED: endophilin-A isoform X1 [Polistes canadensis]XP_014600652.1 PREDICTED: endophilin-A isoform X1 [Polistes canadensis]XP_014600653.1 PREDICTED: endophilin-A isoform X1 [Polistes canadensis]XP_014600654.1 PREDICTED: endophilin-A isoform X1 [Polistes canadensis]
MAFAGLKKQINKANQYMTEKMGGAEGTKLDVDFVDMERKTDVTNELVEELQMKTKEFLQPNPTARAKMAAVKGISKLSGQAKASTYPQPEGVLGDCMLMYGKKLGEDSIFAQALIEMGDAMKQMADVKYSLDDNIKQNFLEPLHHLQTKDLKEVMHHRKKLQGRRLDFDCKRRRQAKGSHFSDDEIKQAEEKFIESLHLAQLGMFNLLENDVSHGYIEQVAQLATFSEALLEYHQQCTEILRVLTEKLLEKKEEAAIRPKMEFVPKPFADLHVEGLTSSDAMNGGNYSLHGSSRAGSPIHGDGKRSQLELFPAGNPPQSANASPLPSPSKSPARTPMARQPCCTALYDFIPENEGELGFKENETITLIQKIDENWYEGSLNGRKGYFPVTYVQVVVPLP